MKTKEYLSITCSFLVALGIRNILGEFDGIPTKVVTGIIILFIGFAILLFTFYDREKKTDT
jgi:uncharacterized membrane protein (Fun14 family)